MSVKKSRGAKADAPPRRIPSRNSLLLVALALLAAGVVLLKRSAHPPIPDPDTASMEPQVAEAIREARARVADSSGAAESWGRLGLVFQAHELFPEASESYTAARDLDPGDFRWPYLLARCQKELQEIGPAIDSVRRAAAIEPRYTPVYVLLAELLEQSGRDDEAVAAYEKVLALDPASAAAELGLGRLALSRGEVEESIARLERAAALQPEAGAIQGTLARAYQRAGDRERAKAAAELARVLHPEVILNDRVMAAVASETVSLVGYQRRAAEASSKGDYAGAEALFRIVIALDPEKADHHYNLANNLSRQGRVEEAAAAYRAALTLDPSHVSALINLGILASRLGDLSEAQMLFERALELEPEHPGALSSLGKLAALEGDGARAVELLERALSRDPGEPETHYALAQVLRQQGLLSLAILSFDRALALAPERADIRFEAAVTSAQAGDYRSAWSHLRRAQQMGFAAPPEFVSALSARMPEPSIP
jgi:tetratricopeptide (TPR) repeat protein